MPNILEEYLVELGATVDKAGMRRFQVALQEVTSFVDHQSLKMAGSFFKAQTEIVGGFAAIGTAALGLVDKVAMADQEYRLFALHMYMSKDAAMALKLTMDALGASLEDITWDPELRKRAGVLIDAQRRMQGESPADTEAQLYKIRDIRAQFGLMEVELKYLARFVVVDFMHALGKGPDELLAKLEKFNKWVIADMPNIAQKLVTDFMPIWHDVEKVVTATGEALRQAAILFTNLVGVISGDSSITGTTLDLDKMVKAVGHVSDGFATFATVIAHAEAMLGHMMIGMSLAAEGKFKEAGSEFKAAGDSITTKEGMAILGAAFGTAIGGPAAGLAFGTVGYDAGAAAERIATAQPGQVVKAGGGLQFDASNFAAVARNAGLSPEFLMAMAMQESGMHQFGPGGKTLRDFKTGQHMGIMQLSSDVAGQYGVDANNPIGNVVGGSYYLRDLFKKYHSLPETIGAYNWGPGNMDKFLAGKASMPSETRNEIAGVLGRMGYTGEVQVGSITIQITQPNATAPQIASAVKKGVKAGIDARTQRHMQEFQDSWATN